MQPHQRGVAARNRRRDREEAEALREARKCPCQRTVSGPEQQQWAHQPKRQIVEKINQRAASPSGAAKRLRNPHYSSVETGRPGARNVPAGLSFKRKRRE